MKLSKKYKKRIAKKINLISLVCLAIVMTMLALFKLTGFSAPLNKQKKIESAEKIGDKTTVTIAADGAIVCDSIVQGVRDSDLADGDYVFRVTGNANGVEETKDYAVELINYQEDITYSLDDGQTSKVVSLGDTTTTYKMLVVKYHKNLTIDAGVTVTATNVSNLTYKKGMYLCVMGELKNNGTISMTARGTYNCEGENVFLWKNVDSSYEYIPENGAAGLPAHQPYYVSGYREKGVKGNDAVGRGTGGGGKGASITNGNNGSSGSWVGATTGGTSYAGGNGVGGMIRCNSSALAASYTNASVTKGGNGYAYDSGSNTYYFAGGGAGATAGSSSYCRLGTGNTETAAQIGVGGLLLLYADGLENNGVISSDGSAGAGASCYLPGNYRGAVGGGGSGGGSVNIFYNELKYHGTIQANGGAGGDVQKCTNNNMGVLNGAPGGNGSVTLTQLKPDLNYNQKVIQVSLDEKYKINYSDFTFVKQNGMQTNSLSLGTLTCEILNTDIASLNSNAEILPKKIGKTKILVKDITNDISTYIYLEVVDKVKVDVQEGNNFTIALKKNGTVWGYGLNNVGQLGNGTFDNSSVPVQVGNLNNIRQIAVGEKHALALSKDGNVYVWGAGDKGQLGIGDRNNLNNPVLIDTLKDIVKIDAYKNINIAIDKNGKSYVWGEDKSDIPMRIVFSEKVIDVSGKLLLTEIGEVYSIDDLDNPIEGLKNIAKISCGYDHNLFLSLNGILYSSGNNTYGECGINDVTTLTIPVEIMPGVYEISAGKNLSIIQTESEEVYVIGNNEFGNLGIENVTKVEAFTKLELTEKIENISAGEYTHSGLIDQSGFVWHAGTNIYGESCVSETDNVNVYTKTGDAIVTVNQSDKVYLDIDEKIDIFAKLENTYNLKIDLIDDVQSNFEIIIPDNTKLLLNDKQITAVSYGSNIVTIRHTGTGIEKQIEISVIMKMKSIVQGFKDIDLPDGEYEILIEDQVYSCELINYYDDVKYSLEDGQTSRIVSLGDDTTEHKTLVVKYHKNLIIDEGVTVTANQVNGLTYKKGMYLCVLGNIVNNGTISMTAKGTYDQEGEDIYLWKNIDNSFEVVPADGAEGHEAYIPGVTRNGINGIDGENRATGGGGQGGAIINGLKGSAGSYVGASTGGTSYSGGNASGSVVRCNIGALAATYTEASDNKGGNASAYDDNSNSSYFAGGGAGITGGTSSYNRISVGNSQSVAESGTGGLLILYTNNLQNSGEILSEGSKGAGGSFSFSKNFNGAVGGPGSGGGSINIFANSVLDMGIVSATGGQGGVVSASRGNMGVIQGANGGNGTVTINELGSVLNYADKSLTMKVNNTHKINKDKLSYTKLNDIQTEDLVIGTITFETLNSDIVSVENDGTILANNSGRTKIKITDTTNGYSTYINIHVIDDNESKITETHIAEGTNFTIALKENGTVWSYGKNDNGQLGIGSDENSSKPVQVMTSDNKKLTNIVKIDAGNNNAIACDNLGNVYTWGDGTSFATKVNNISNIIQVDSFNGVFSALDINGNVYVWNKENSNPTKLDIDAHIIQISGELILDSDGFVYNLNSENEKVPYLSNICYISCGENSYAAVTLDGHVYTYGAGTKGQLGNGKYTDTNIPALVKTTEGYLENIYKVSVGNECAIAITFDGEIYTFGDNSNSKIGITGDKIEYATKIEKVQDKEGNTLELKKFENIAAGYTKSSISDEDGFVYSVGLNTYGELGTEDTIDRSVFTLIGEKKVITIPDTITIEKNQSNDVSIIVENTFNLKTDIDSEEKINITNTNENVSKIEEKIVDNKNIIDKEKYNENYTITGNKIGRVNLVAESTSGYKKNIWVNIVSSADAIAAAKVVNGDNYTIALKSDGTVWSYGYNEKGQLGLGDSQNRNVPTQIELEEKIIDIATGENHTLLLTEKGEVYSFGINTNGQLGLGNTTSYKSPMKIQNINNISKVVAIANKSYLINEAGKVYAFGEEYSKVPSLLSMEENIINISKKYYLTEEGIVKELSTNEQIQLSLNQTDPSQDPVVEDERIFDISEGINHILMLAQSGRVYSYGENVYGQLGDTTTIGRTNKISTAVKIEDNSILENVKEISAGDRYSIAVTKDGKIYTFGINETKELGHNNNVSDGGIQESLYAIIKEDISDVERVVAGYNHTSVIKVDGNVYDFGQGTEGQLGNGVNNNSADAVIVGKNIIETNKTSIVIEEEENIDIDAWISYFNLFEEKTTNLQYQILDSSLGLINSTTGELMAIGEGRTTILVKEIGTNKIAIIDLRVLKKGTRPEEQEITIEPQVETSGSHVVMLKVDGSVWTYGIGTYGELGNGTTDNIDEPIQVKFPTETTIIQIATGENHVLALDSDGFVWAWGKNQYYQLGNNIYGYSTTPQKIDGLNNIKKIACGSYNSFAITENGEMYGFGLNANGECGIGSYTNKIMPIKAKNMTDIIDVKAGKNHTIVLKSTGEVYATGSNIYGELGINDLTVRKINEFRKIELGTVVKIATSEGNTSVIMLDGAVYTWGANVYNELGLNNTDIIVGKPTKVTTLKNIKYIDGGKGYNIALNSNNEVFMVGQNAFGELGNDLKTNLTSYTKLSTIKDVMYVSGGKAYTNYLKIDGTVWASGDYTYGDEAIKSKTKSAKPIQVGNDETGFNKNEIVLNVSKNKDIGAERSYEFNLIKLNKNYFENLVYTSLNDNIATINEKGVVTGNRVGTTRIKAESTLDGKIYSIIVRVIDEEATVAPQAGAGENFAGILKGDGTLWTFGYNGDGRLGLGNYISKDIPSKTNILSTYEKMAVGNNFMIALRSDGTVWSVGNNSKGQCGNGTTNNKNKLSQIQGLQDVVKIAAGEDYAVAVDSYGIVYTWGNGNLKPEAIETAENKIVDVVANKNEIVFVTDKGTVYGHGTILEGTLKNSEDKELNNVISVEVTNTSIIILTNDEKAYKYVNGSLHKIELDNVIDIAAKGKNMLLQTKDEEIYVLGENENGQLGTGNKTEVTIPTLANSHGTSVFTMAVGNNNTYIIKNTGNVYAVGTNEYGEIGNGTRDESLEYILVGNRNFEIQPLSKTMQLGNTEELEISGEPFNVFNSKKISADEYNFTSDNSDIVEVTTINGIAKLVANSNGTAHINVEDKITGEIITLTRIVVEPSQDRIETISVNTKEAQVTKDSTETNINYEVKVVTDNNTGILKITTNNLTDRISVDGGLTWSYNGNLSQTIDLTDKVTELTILVGIQNNEGEYATEKEYNLTVERISDDSQIKEITVSSISTDGTESRIKAKPVSLTRYEVIVEEDTIISLAKVIANNEYANVSIDGKEYELKEQEKDIIIDTNLTKEVNIVIKSEFGTETEYTLVIYKESKIFDLESLTVNDIESSKISEGVYAIKIPENVTEGTVVAKVSNNLVEISLDNNEYKAAINKKVLKLENTQTIVNIKVKVADKIKEYTLNIYKEAKQETNLGLNMLMVNGNLIQPEADKLTYIAYLPSAEIDATIRAIALDITNNITITDKTEVADCENVVALTGNENTYQVIVSDEENTKTYTVIIRKAEADASLMKILVAKDDNEVLATKVSDKNYKVKVPSTYETVDVTAITRYISSKVKIEPNTEYTEHIAIEKVELLEDITEVKIVVESQDGTNVQEYALVIEKMDNNTRLQEVLVDGNIVTLSDDGKYHYTLLSAVTSVEVKAIAENSFATVSIAGQSYELTTSTRNVDITAKETTEIIRVKSEDGTIKNYELVIEGLPDDTNIQKVEVNGIEAKYIEGKNRYEIRSEAKTFNVEVTLSDALATVELENNAATLGYAQLTVEKQGEETILKAKVVSQNKLEVEEYVIAILEKSNNANVDSIKVNGKNATIGSDGKYHATIMHDATNIKVVATAEDEYAITTIDENTNNSNVMTVNTQVEQDKKIYEYEITIKAEDGTLNTYELEVEQLEGNTNIIKVCVAESINDFDENKQQEAILQDDGTYYLKVNRINNAYIDVELESEKSTVTINGKTSKPLEIGLSEEVTEILLEVTGEDGTKATKKLIIEKKSNDTTIKEVISNQIIKTERNGLTINIYVDEDETNIDLDIILNNENGTLKLEAETDYIQERINRTISLANYEENGNVSEIVNVRAEDGTEVEYSIIITKQANLNVKSVIINGEETAYNQNEERYYKLVANADKPVVEITADNIAQKVELINEAGTVVTSGKGKITTTLTLPEQLSKYVIRITSHNGETYGIQEYDMVIRQKSTETGITYVKVDSLGTLVDSTGLIYASTVSGKEKYPIEIKLKDINAKASLLDTEGNILIDYQKGVLIGNIDIPDGETKTFKIIVQSENNEEKQYTLTVERISSNTEIESINVEDYDEDGTTIVNKQVVIYDEAAKTYKIVVNKYLTESAVTIVADSSFTKIDCSELGAAQGTLTFTKDLSGLGINKITMKLTAADGTTEMKYLEIIQLSDEIGIQELKVDGNVIEANDIGDYEVTVTDEEPTSFIEIILPIETSKVSLNGELATLEQGNLTVVKGNRRTIEIPIQVTAEDGSSYKYILTINVISHDSNVEEIRADQELANKRDDGEYIVYIDKYATSTEMDVTAKVMYSNIVHEKTDGELEEGLSSLKYIVSTDDLNQTEYITTFKIVAEDGTETEYAVHLIRKSDDNSIKEVRVDDKEILPNEGLLEYLDGTYYATVIDNVGGITNAKVRVETNDEYATIEYNGQQGMKVLEQTIALGEEKITEIPLKIVSQQGTVYETVIYIEKVSNNNKIAKVEVNNIEAEKDEFKYVGYIYDTLNSAKVKITAENENATIVRTTILGETYLNESGVSNIGKGTLELDITTLEQKTEMYFKIIAENGEETEIQKLYIEKMSTDTSLETIFVNGEKIEPNEEGKYVTSILDNIGNPTVKAVTNHELAHVRIALGNEYLHVSQEDVTMSDSKQTIIPITVRSQSGITKVTYLYINQISTSIDLTVTVNDKEANYYNSNMHTYTYLVGQEETEFDMFVLAESDYTILEYEGIEYEASVRDRITMNVGEEGKTVTIKAKSESGIVQEYKINIVRESDSVKLEYLKVNGEIREPDEENGDTYTVMIPKKATSTLIEVGTEYSYAMVRLGDNQIIMQHDEGQLDCSDLTEQRILVPIVVTAADGETIRTYNLLLLRAQTQIRGNVITENAEGKHKALVSLYLTSDTREIDDKENPRKAIEQIETEDDGSFKIDIEDEATYDVVITKLGYLSYKMIGIEIVEGDIVEITNKEIYAGDIVKTGEIEIDDLVELNDNIGKEIDSINISYDLNEDGFINNLDRAILKANYGKTEEVARWEEINRLATMSETTEANKTKRRRKEDDEEDEEIILPIACSYTITSDYGERVHPVTGVVSKHTGIDLAGTHHTEIFAVASGEVTYAGVQNGFGNCVEIKHEINGEVVYSFYAHLSRIDVKAGDTVAQGDIIGLEGGDPTVDPNPGSSTGHHLHFEIRTASGYGNDIDPSTYIEF